MIAGNGVSGAEISGNLEWTAQGWFTLPEAALARQGVVIGGSGSGKTITLLRLAYIAARVYGDHVPYIDAKSDRHTATAFISLITAMVRATWMFPSHSLN